MRKRRNFRKRPKDNAQGLSVTVYNNNLDDAIPILEKWFDDLHAQKEKEQNNH